MTSIDSNPADFRAQAVAASESLQRTLPRDGPLEKSGTSYCLVRQPSLTRLRAPIRITAVASGVLGLAAIVTGLVIGLLLVSRPFADNAGLIAIAVCCFVGGTQLMFVPTFVERWIVRHYLAQCDYDYGSGSQVKGIHAFLEYAPTYGSLKLLAEDVGLIYIHPEDHYVKMDGLSYEYVIQSKDVVDLSLHSNNKTVLLSYRVGEELLELAIGPRSILAELKRQTVGSSRSLFLKMQDALRPDEGVD